MKPMQKIFGDLSTNLAASVIYDFSQRVINKATSTEFIQNALKKAGLSPKLHDFSARYVESLVELRSQNKQEVVLNFFREESIMGLFFNYFYGNDKTKGDEAIFQKELDYWINALAVGDDVKENGINIEGEVIHFWRIFKQKIQESRTLKEAEDTALLKDIKRTVDNIDKPETGLDKILGSLPFKPEIFIGRKTDLEAIRQKLIEEDNLLLLVNGEGGIGKTTIAARYFFSQQDAYTHLAWIYAEKSLLDALMTLSVPLKMDYPPQMPNEERLDLLLSKMRTLAKPCLLVIDNANDLEDLEQFYIALKSCPNFHLILTTRITEFEQAATYRVLPLSDADANTLFQQYYSKYTEIEDDLLKKVFAAIGKNTLVIELLAKNIFHFNRLRNTYSLNDLVADLQERGLLGIKNKTKVRTSYKAGNLALRKEKPEDIIAAMYDLGELPKEEKRLMSIFSVLPAENIPYLTIESLLPETKAVDDSLLFLAQRGWLEFNETLNTFKVSPVVQAVVKEKNEDLLSDCEELMDSLADKLTYDPGSTGHLLNSTYQEAHIYSKYIESILSSIKPCNNSIILLYERLGGYNKAVGNFKKALTYFTVFYELSIIYFKKYPEDSTFKLWVMLSLEKVGATYSILGDLNKALSTITEHVRLAEELLEMDTDNYKLRSGLSVAYSRLGVIHMNSSNLEKALDLFEKSKILARESIGKLNRNNYQKLNLGYSYQFIGNIYFQLGKYDIARTNFEEMLAIFRQLSENVDDASFKNGYGVFPKM